MIIPLNHLGSLIRIEISKTVIGDCLGSLLMKFFYLSIGA